MRKLSSYVLLFTFLLIWQSSEAGKVEGVVTDVSGNPLPFCNIYLSHTTFACASNENGTFSLTAPDGKYQLIFQYIGFKKQEIAVDLGITPLHLEIKMEQDITELQQVEVHADQEDPAYAVIRKAIAARPDHLKDLNAYSCDVYIKGLQKLTEAPDKIMGIELKTVVDVDTDNTGIIYLSESQSTFNYQYPDKTKEIMHASIVSGNDRSFSWNDAASMQMNFYQNLETLKGFSQRGFVSPVADNALFFYDYHLVSNTFENGHEIFKISVMPRRETDPVYSGTIYITDDDYRTTGLQLQLVKANGLEFIDTFKVEQEFIYQDDQHLVMLSNKFTFNYGFFGIKGNGFFHAIYNNYNLAPNWPDHFFNAEVSRIEDNANKKDSTYWNHSRPVMLTPEEQQDYQQKDSLKLLKESPAYMDSLDKIFNRPSPGDLLSGYHFRNSGKQIFINSNPIFELLQFNTVEGYVINPRVRINKQWEDHRELTIVPGIRYATGRDQVFANGYISWLYHQPTSSEISLRGGSYIVQFNENGIQPLVNTFYSLLLEQNYFKLYRSDLAAITWKRELVNGGVFSIESKYAHRRALQNWPEAKPWIDDPARSFTDNAPAPADEATTFVENDLFYIQLHFRYAIKQTYLSEPHRKYILDSKYPIIQLNIKRAVPGIWQSDADFTQLEISVNDNIALGLPGNLTYYLQAGSFIQSKYLFLGDAFHFSGNETLISKLTDDGFFMLPYYGYSTEKYFAEGHIQWHTEGFLFKKLPVIKQLKVEPVFSLNYLQTELPDPYFEVGFGLEHIFKFARLDVAYSPNVFDEPFTTTHWRLLAGIGF